MNRKLEIGHTWLAASTQRTGINTEAKYLLLAHAFEAMNCVRVQFTTDELNEKSRAAILGIGAKQEGIVRHERIMPDGRKRNSVRFSIIDDEWPAVKAMLLAKLTPSSVAEAFSSFTRAFMNATKPRVTVSSRSACHARPTRHRAG